MNKKIWQTLTIDSFLEKSLVWLNLWLKAVTKERSVCSVSTTSSTMNYHAGLRSASQSWGGGRGKDRVRLSGGGGVEEWRLGENRCWNIVDITVAGSSLMTTHLHTHTHTHTFCCIRVWAGDQAWGEVMMKKPVTDINRDGESRPLCNELLTFSEDEAPNTCWAAWLKNIERNRDRV